jgi:hypothetical protein
MLSRRFGSDRGGNKERLAADPDKIIPAKPMELSDPAWHTGEAEIAIGIAIAIGIDAAQARRLRFDSDYLMSGKAYHYPDQKPGESYGGNSSWRDLLSLRTVRQWSAPGLYRRLRSRPPDLAGGLSPAERPVPDPPFRQPRLRADPGRVRGADDREDGRLDSGSARVPGPGAAGRNRPFDGRVDRPRPGGPLPRSGLPNGARQLGLPLEPEGPGGHVSQFEHPQLLAETIGNFLEQSPR